MADSTVMMALGDFRFSLDTAAFQSLERTSSWRWDAIDRMDAAPGQQFCGPGEDTVSMNGTIYPAYRGGLGQVAAMRAEAAKGQALLLVDGTGGVWGRYCITEIRETRETFFSNGVPRKIDFGITLKAHGGEVDD